MTSMNLFRFVQRFRRLPPDQQVLIDRLVDSLSDNSRDARLVDAASGLSEPAFAAVWENDEDADYDRL
ncbi:MAG: toxin-antitoxin system, antitoxin component, Xre family protein [Gammaproteobacteria bacterium]